MLSADWYPHARDDGEVIGWITADGEDWAAIDVLGRRVAGPVDWIAAETALEEVGLRFLADPWMLEPDLDDDASAPVLRVQIVEVTPYHEPGQGRIVVKVDDFGDMRRPPTDRHVLAWPIPGRLRPVRPGDPDGRTL